MSHNVAAVNAHRVRFARLLDVLRADLAVEPRYRASNDREWLAWAHGTRWHLRALFESYCAVVAHEPDALPSPLAVAPVTRLLDYFDSVFQSDSPIAVERSGVLYATLAWSESSVTAIQDRACDATPADPPQYSAMPMYLDDFRSLPSSLHGIAVLVDSLLADSRSLLADSRSHTLELRRLTDRVEGIALNGRDAPPTNTRNIPVRGIPTGPRRGRGGSAIRGGCNGLRRNNNPFM
ncbi:hypothetical protein FOMPIDRAFT_1055292 [Fomitopsis schrenkii]|uniref:Uncharacterized protein n=1 Tax=Fomitopsis schrenkii TaxID=2126942 RepID=S8EXF1_FOMSC|nr:hypothetical protein FOMPIDRAFT_1055292 [Fomitopsis schrenkii]